MVQWGVHVRFCVFYPMTCRVCLTIRHYAFKFFGVWGTIKRGKSSWLVRNGSIWLVGSLVPKNSPEMPIIRLCSNTMSMPCRRSMLMKSPGALPSWEPCWPGPISDHQALWQPGRTSNGDESYLAQKSARLLCSPEERHGKDTLPL